ncbi:UNVERIFIED_CONTAM: putative kinase-like protein TMKL1 [Sesamum radiatum]|uniref:Kinase-like protein TMKL1 n=1 Tax=Sesamum radiatum TaxID=300843 RepID=A0AAW2NCD7_SESRA
MRHRHKLMLIIGLTSVTVLTILLFTVFCCRRRKAEHGSRDVESAFECKEGDGRVNTEDLIKFHGGEDLTVEEILDAPGEVIGKSSYGTLYRASLVNSDSLALLRFLRPTCTLRIKEVVPILELLGSVRHPNLVPLYAFYAGPRGEKLMVHPFYGPGNLAQFIKGQQMLELSASQGYKAPELMKMKDASKESDIYSLGVIFLELLTGKLAIDENSTPDQDFCLPGALRNAVLDDQMVNLYHPDILLGLSNDQRIVTEDRVLRFFQLAMACCSPTRLLRPDINQILEKLQEIGK